MELNEWQIRELESALDEADENLIKTSIYAPMSGTISMLLVEKGERVDGGIQLIKYWFEVGMEEQERRFEARLEDPTKRWKLSEIVKPAKVEE